MERSKKWLATAALPALLALAGGGCIDPPAPVYGAPGDDDAAGDDDGGDDDSAGDDDAGSGD